MQQIIDDTIKQEMEQLKTQQTNWMGKILGGMKNMDIKEQDKGLRAARMIRALAAAKGDAEKAAAYAKKTFGDEELSKALSASDAAGGGVLVPTEYSTDLIELLRPMAVVRRMGAVIMPMATGVVSIPKITGGGSAQYVGENMPIPTTQQTFGNVVLTWKKLATIVPISNDLIRYSSPAADAIVRDDLVSAMAQREDLAFIRDDGTNNKPKGIFYWIPTDNKIAATAPVTVQSVVNDLGKLELALKNANVRFIRPGFIMSPRTEAYLKNLMNDTGNYIFKQEMMAGRLNGYPYAVTTQIPQNLGVNGNETEVYLVDFADAIIGEAQQLIIDASQDAAYVDGGNVVAAFANDQTVIRVIAEHDFAMRHEESAAVLTGVTWGV